MLVGRICECLIHRIGLHAFFIPFFFLGGCAFNMILCLLHSDDDDVMRCDQNLHTSQSQSLKKLHYLRRLLDYIIYLLSLP